MVHDYLKLGSVFMRVGEAELVGYAVWESGLDSGLAIASCIVQYESIAVASRCIFHNKHNSTHEKKVKTKGRTQELTLILNSLGSVDKEVPHRTSPPRTIANRESLAHTGSLMLHGGAQLAVSYNDACTE
jgi:hypothetical protein